MSLWERKSSVYVLSIGNAFDGLRLVGPFEWSQEAQDWAEEHAKGEEWNVVHVEKPAEES